MKIEPPILTFVFLILYATLKSLNTLPFFPIVIMAIKTAGLESITTGRVAI